MFICQYKRRSFYNFAAEISNCSRKIIKQQVYKLTKLFGIMPSLIIKLNRFSAWLLVILMIVYFFTGFDSLKNIWNPEFSRYLHDKILPLPTLFLVAFHAFVGLKIYLLRQLLENKFINYLLYTTGLIIFLIFIYLFFR